jgi:hypothetical protein
VGRRAASYGRQQLLSDCSTTMHIKSIIIRGFKSYKDEVRMEDLNNKHNAISEFLNFARKLAAPSLVAR